MAKVKHERRQIRAVVQEMLPQVFKQELTQEVYNRLSKEMNTKLNSLEKYIKDTLELLDKRSSDSLSYLVRNASIAQPLTPPEFASPAIEDSNEEVAQNETN